METTKKQIKNTRTAEMAKWIKDHRNVIEWLKKRPKVADELLRKALMEGGHHG